MNFRIKVVDAVILVCALAGGWPLRAAEHSSALRLENRLNWKLNDKWSVGGNVQARLHDSLREVYYRQLDSGASVKLTNWLQLPVNFRLEDRLRDDGWVWTSYLLFDPTLKLPARGHWRFDVRTRLQYVLDDNILQYLRIQPRAWYSFSWKKKPLGWWVYNDFYIRIADWDQRTNYRSNNFCTGVNCVLNGKADINLYYLLFSAKATPEAALRHVHQACVSLGFAIGGRRPGVPPQSTN